MTGEERLNEFVSAIEKWKLCKNLVKVEENENVSRLLNMKYEELLQLSYDECLAFSYELHAYAEYIESVKAKEDIILNWAESSLWYIICDSMNQYGGQYAKWQEKYYSSIKENPLASQILVIKNFAESRVTMLNGKSTRVQKMAEILNSLSRRKV